MPARSGGILGFARVAPVSLVVAQAHGVRRRAEQTGGPLAAAYSPRIRPGAPVSFPVAWGELERVQPRDFTVHTVPHLIAGRDPWLSRLPEQELSRDLIAEGHTIPIARVQAMHEGKRRAHARRDGPGDRHTRHTRRESMTCVSVFPRCPAVRRRA